MRELKGMFDRWTVDEENGVMWDDGGNEYKIGEIRSIFFLRQWMYESGGYHGRIKNLKEQLEKKIERVKEPEVTINWGDIEEKFIHPHYRINRR
jgi:hypothetical protein